MTFKSTGRLTLCLALPLITGLISAYFASQGLKSWYDTLSKPFFSPPNYIYGPVWTILYLLMGVSLYMIWKAEPGPIRTKAILIFAAQLSLNFLWGILFFKLEMPALAMADILFMWLTILYMILTFTRIKHSAAYLQIPYLLWATFATLLNGTIWCLN